MSKPNDATHVNTSYDDPIYLKLVSGRYKSKLQIYSTIDGDDEHKWRDCKVLGPEYVNNTSNASRVGS